MSVLVASLPFIHGDGALHLQYVRHAHHRYSTTFFNWGPRTNPSVNFIVQTRGRAVRMQAKPNVSTNKSNSKKEVIMVDPLEAKRLAGLQLKEIKALEKKKRRSQIEAINGAWAMIGLTAGLVIEGKTGKGFLAQLAGYWFAIIHFFIGDL